MPKSEAMKLPIFRYYFPVADKYGSPISCYRMVTGYEFLKITGFHPFDRKLTKEQLMKSQPELYRALYLVA